MSDADKNDEDRKSQNQGSEDTDNKGDSTDKEGKDHPESVPWKQYVGTKESLGNKIQEEKDKVKSLEEQLKETLSKEDAEKLKTELAEANKKVETLTDEINQGKEKTAKELREALKGTEVFTEDELNAMSEAELRAAVKAAGSKKKASLPDLKGGAGGGGTPSGGSPLKQARDAYSSSNK